MVLVNGELCHHPLRQLQVGDVISFRDINLKRRLAYFFMRRLVKFQAYRGLESTLSRKHVYRKGKYNRNKGKGFQDRRFNKGKNNNQKQLSFHNKSKDRAKFRKNDFKNKSFKKGKAYARLPDKPKKKPRYNPFGPMPRRTFSNIKKLKKKQKKKKWVRRSPIVLKRLNEQRIKKMSPILLTHLGGLRQYNLIFLPRLLAIQVVDKAYLLKNVYYPNALDFEVLKVHFKSLS